jgi:hypothetical protein
MVTHFAKVTTNKLGWTRTHTLCGRSNSASKDGFNSTDKREEVTCKFCLKRLAQ